MNFVEELQSLDTSDPGRWPFLFRAIAVAIVFVAVAAGGIYMFVVKTEMPLLERAEREESELRATFEQKQRKAANFDAYRAQLAEIERSFGAMLRQLPGKTEVPNLLVDISQTGLAAIVPEAGDLVEHAHLATRHARQVGQLAATLEERELRHR